MSPTTKRLALLLPAAPLVAACEEESAHDEEATSCEARVELLRERIASTEPGFDVPESAAPWVSKKAKEIRATQEPSQRAALIAEGMSKSIHGCAQLVEVFKRIATMPASEKDATFKKETPEAIAACDCEGVDVDAFETMARFSVLMEPRAPKARGR